MRQTASLTSEVLRLVLLLVWTATPGWASRRLGAPARPLSVRALLRSSPLHCALWELPPGVCCPVVNVPGIGIEGGGEPASLEALERLGIQRGASDVLAIGEDTRVLGTVSCKSFSVTTRYGTATIPLKQIAALVGRRYTGTKTHVFLRDGQVFCGRVEAEGLRLTMPSGLDVKLDADTLDRLVMRQDSSDGRPAAEVELFVETFWGDRLAVLSDAEQRLTVVTCWGEVVAALSEVRSVDLVEGQPGCLVRLRDGSRFFGYPDGAPLALKTALFGLRKLRATSVRQIRCVGLEAEAGEEPAIDEPHVQLVGDNVLVGGIDVDRLHFVARGQVIPLAPSQIRTLENRGAGQAGGPWGGCLFHAAIWTGGEVTGTLRETVLPVRVRDRVCRVPVDDLVAARVPSPIVPEGLRAKIATLIRDLGHPQWEKRDAATRELVRLGAVARPQLTEARRQAADPEVRRRVEAILERMSKP